MQFVASLPHREESESMSCGCDRSFAHAEAGRKKNFDELLSGDMRHSLCACSNGNFFPIHAPSIISNLEDAGVRLYARPHAQFARPRFSLCSPFGRRLDPVFEGVLDGVDDCAPNTREAFARDSHMARAHFDFDVRPIVALREERDRETKSMKSLFDRFAPELFEFLSDEVCRVARAQTIQDPFKRRVLQLDHLVACFIEVPHNRGEPSSPIFPQLIEL